MTGSACIDDQGQSPRHATGIETDRKSRRTAPQAWFPCRDTCKPDILLAAHKLVLDSKEKLAAGEPLAATILVN